jgi:transposase
MTESSSPASTPIGVGIDTSRYGHHASFLRPDLQPAAADLDFAESAAGYAQLRQRLTSIAERCGSVHFHIRLDVAGAYADNLLAFLGALPDAKTISCGEPQRNKNYRTAVFGHKKSDAIESAAAARYALQEQPRDTPSPPVQLALLRQVAGRLDAQVRQVTRLVNQLHHLLARTFPELALLTKDLAAGWVLRLLERYPSAAKIAAARPASLEAISYLPHKLVPKLQDQARASVASLVGPVAEELVRDQVRQVREAQQRQKSLEQLLVAAYRDLPEDNHLATIIGIGAVTAAILTAKIVAIERFETPEKLVGYFGVYPVEAASGIDRDGQPRPPKRYVMCPRGCDLVRRYLYTAALSAAQHNPAVQPLYQRVRAKHPDHPVIAVGHAMRKLLHLVFAVWTTSQPFDAERAGESPAPSVNEQAAGHNPETVPEKSVVTAACLDQSTITPASTATSSRAAPWIDFAHLRRQLPIARVLEHVGGLSQFHGRGAQRRGPCPVHAADGCGRTFSVHLDQHVFHCFDAACGIEGDVIDLWAALKKLSPRDAALDLVRTFGLEPAPTHGPEKRHG